MNFRRRKTPHPITKENSQSETRQTKSCYNDLRRYKSLPSPAYLRLLHLRRSDGQSGSDLVVVSGVCVCGFKY